MTEEELLSKYNIGPEHRKWDPSLDNWAIIELYRSRNNGNLPSSKDGMKLQYVLDFMDNMKPDYKFHPELGQVYITCKRFTYRHLYAFLEFINNK